MKVTKLKGLRPAHSKLLPARKVRQLNIPYSSAKLHLKAEFNAQSYPEYPDGAPCLIEIVRDGATSRAGIVQCAIRGYVDILDAQQLAGWVYDVAGYPDAKPFELDILVDGSQVRTIRANIFREDLRRVCGFYLDLSSYTSGRPSFTIEIRPRGIDQAILKTPISVTRKEGIIEVMHDLALRAREGGQQQPKSQYALLRKLPWPKIIDLMRLHFPQNGKVFYEARAEHDTEIVDVVVPVYDGFEDTVRCLTALFESRQYNQKPFRVILVDDRGPDQALRKHLGSYEGKPQTVLIRNDKNLGFVRSVNKALARAHGRDVVLLNADAVVHGDWLDRMHRAAYSSPAVASVTPFSNNATICSYPDPVSENAMPEDISLAELDGLFNSANTSATVSIPTGVGFCMYMRGDAIAEVGFLDAEKYGMGYGEENDWCIRARDMGWKHLHALDTFVEHIGGVSFGQDKKAALVESNLKLLGASYPEYLPVIMDFIRQDPARGARNRVTMQRLQVRLEKASKRLLYINHGLSGGIEVYCRDMAQRLARKNIAVLMLESKNSNGMCVKYQELKLDYHATPDNAELLNDLALLSIDRIHLHSDIGFDPDIWQLSELLEVPFDFTIHDYLAVCPRVNFTLPDGSYCGEPVAPALCNACISQHGTFDGLEKRFIDFGSDVLQWRNRYRQKLERATVVIAPDEDVALRVNGYLPNLPVTVTPHPFDRPMKAVAAPKLQPGQELRVAVIGAIGPHKGFYTLLQCVKDAHRGRLPLSFMVIGSTCNDQVLQKYPNITITGKYQPDQLQKIILKQKPQVALFLSPWPETYSYTLSEALAAGLYPVVLPIGALAARVERLRAGLVLGEALSPEDINQALVNLAFPIDGRAKNPKASMTVKTGRRNNALVEH